MPNREGVSRETPPTSPANHSCNLCHRRKVKCDKKNPCTYCVTRGIPCTPAPPPIRRPRKKRFPEAELLARLRRYEAALKVYGADLDSINGDTHTSDRRASTCREHNRHSTRCRALNSREQRDQSADSSGTESEIRDQKTDDGEEQCPILTTNYTTSNAGDSTLLFNLGCSLDLPSLHPQPVQIFRLWQVLLDNVHPLLKLFHAPSVQQGLLKCAGNLPASSSTMHALLFGIYANAVVSMTDDACLAILEEDRWTLVSRYTTGAQYALHKSGFLQSSDLTVLQALVLYLYSVMKIVDPQTFFSLTAIADRIAKRDGLHQNISCRGTSAFTAEMRRRVWWQIVLLDGRAAEVSGAGTSIFSCAWNTKLPLNVNENELNPETDTLPHEHERATDMIFCLVRCEIAEFLRQFRSKSGLEDGLGECSNPFISVTQRLEAIDEFEKHLQAKYLVHCDSHISLHILTRYYAVQSISKMRIFAYGALSRRNRSGNPTMSEESQDQLMQVCLEAIESYDQCVANQSLMRFAWFLAVNIPFLAYVHLLYNLQQRTKGDLVTRAWQVVTQHDDLFGRPESLKGFGSRLFEADDGTLQATFAGLVVRAWEARDAALASENPVPVPPMVHNMRRILSTITGRDAQGATNLHRTAHGRCPGMQASAPMSSPLGNWPGPTSIYANRSDPSPLGVNLPLPPPIADESAMPMQAPQAESDLFLWDQYQAALPGDGMDYNMDWNPALFSMYG